MNKKYGINDFVLDEARQRIINSTDGSYEKISPHEFLVLLELIKKSGEIVSKEELLQKGWPNRVVSENSLSQAIKNLRLLLKDNSKEQRVIKTIAKKGYLINSMSVVQITDENYDNAILINKEHNKNRNIGMSILILLLITTIFNVFWITKNIKDKFFLDSNIQYPTLSYHRQKINIYSENYNLSYALGERLNVLLNENESIKSIYILINSDNFSISYIDTNNQYVNNVYKIGSDVNHKTMLDVIYKVIQHEKL
ncbi:TPA: transcriptional regulator [Vibrio cholerae]